jgi:hypothetical protein
VADQTFEITAPNGKTLEITGDRMPTEAELHEIFAKAGVDTKAGGPAPPEGSALGRFASNLGEKLNPVAAVKGVVQAVTHPVDTYHAAVDASAQQFGKAREAYQQGRYSEAVGHGVAGALPVIGPAAADVGEQIGRGDVAGGLGGATGLLAPFAAGPAVSAARGALPARAAAVVNPTVEFARARGIPLDAATVSNNFAVKGVQALADRSVAGDPIATTAKAAQAAAMERVSGELADAAHGTPITAEQAGTSLRDALVDKAKAHNATATDAYDTLRAIEQHTPMPVALAPQKAALKPLYDSLKRQAELVPLQGDKGRALVALDRLMTGPNVASLSDVDAALGDLKAMARADIPELRTAGQGAAALAVKQLEAAVQSAAKRGGPKAYDALTKGREATIAKYQVADVLDTLNAEPVKTVKALTAPKDTAIQKLRAVVKEAPGQTPELARAYLEDLLDAPQKVADWRKLGPETKATLFPAQGQVEALNRFFELTDRISKTNVNPSGSGYMAALGAQGAMLWTMPHVAVPMQIGAAALSKLMRSPAAIDALTQGLRLPASAPAGARTLVTARLLKAAAQAGVNLDQTALPLAAQREDRSPAGVTGAGPQ